MQEPHDAFRNAASGNRPCNLPVSVHSSTRLPESKWHSASASSTQLLLKQLIDHLRTGLSFGCLHDLPDKIAEQRSLAPAILLKLPGACRNHLIDDLLNGGGVGDLLGLFSLIHRGKIFAIFKSLVVEVLENLAGDGFRLQQ